MATVRQLTRAQAPTGVVAGTQVILREFQWLDVPNYVRWVQEAEAKKFFNPFLTSEDPFWLVSLWFKPATDILGIWAPEGSDGKLCHVGGIGFQHIDRVTREAEFGFLIGRPEWRDKGYGTDALAALVKYAFNDLDLLSLYAQVVESNTRSLKVLRKVGFLDDGEGKPINVPGQGESRVLRLRLTRSNP